jgi:hypothetical protein
LFLFCTVNLHSAFEKLNMAYVTYCKYSLTEEAVVYAVHVFFFFSGNG